MYKLQIANQCVQPEMRNKYEINYKIMNNEYLVSIGEIKH